ncbi:patatin family protein [Peribacillus saganii]|uniref:Patatin family protein n=1 Tax=Peribacillus saganii TaxID=2303992 RepID=A0A372LLE3_9BACI|nr:patatin family protein [Peribacillus saganii]RFU67663.1 patatin family protein [Peribacillus saganii]
MQNTGLVLEGGGMRGAFTAGVLHFFMEQNIQIPYVIGVSAGACQGSSYVSRQIGRNHKVTIQYSTHPEYISVKRFLRSRELFGMDFIFDKLPNELVPFDLKTFHKEERKFVVGTTDCLTGEPVYFEKAQYKQKEDIYTILRASSSLPFMAPEISYDGKYLLDGGIADPLPIKKSEQDGNQKNVVILTRNEGYFKKKPLLSWAIKRKYGHYEGLIRSILNRHEVYNSTVRYLEEQEEKGNVFIIRPMEKLEVGRIERNPAKLDKLYQHGYVEAERRYAELLEFL